MEQIDSEKGIGAFRDHSDELLRARRRFYRIAQHPYASRIRDRGDERWVRDEPHSSAHEWIPHAILARQPRGQAGRVSMELVAIGVERGVVCHVEGAPPGLPRCDCGLSHRGDCAASSSEQRKQAATTESVLCHIDYLCASESRIAGAADWSDNRREHESPS
jgi:hypothetical protein